MHSRSTFAASPTAGRFRISLLSALRRQRFVIFKRWFYLVLMSIVPNYNRPIYEPSKSAITWHNGCKLHLLSAGGTGAGAGFQFWLRLDG